MNKEISKKINTYCIIGMILVMCLFLKAIFVYMISGQAPIAGFLGGAYALCALIRLAYYNVQEYDRQKRTTGKREVFQ